jgi:hypothetical protein
MHQDGKNLKNGPKAPPCLLPCIPSVPWFTPLHTGMDLAQLGAGAQAHHGLCFQPGIARLICETFALCTVFWT